MTVAIDFADPRSPDGSAVELEVLRATSHSQATESIWKGRADGAAGPAGRRSFTVYGLPTGSFQIVARCRGTGVVAGRMGFEIDQGRGFLWKTGSDRNFDVRLPVDPTICAR